ncbi:MAG TPA: MFS transporter [Flavobacteriales bacterium]|jgi:NNP family nitrate/nitrite transporter-like MFS transporter|nr:MFS transporter [Flavobacteriales bacterium]HQW33186.1 MFS transporter [Flavobacteriales bacterium]HQY03836.1 MFS transporter [Flavobacteriales bacterium]HQY80561.1 MFS transporter [Flavobacteriales bacterium]HRA17127.1 MFS transporter [Flavobacteriales bacterium]
MNTMEKATGKSHRMLTLNTLAFTLCFAAWMLNGVLVTFLVDNSVFQWSTVQVGWLLGIPVLTGSLFRLPVGILTDRYGGKWVFTLLLVASAIPMYLLSFTDSFFGFALMSFGFGLTGAGFAVGIANTSVWYPKRQQGLALGIFGAGNAGAAFTTLFAPTLLLYLTHDGADLEGWRQLPRFYAATLVVMAIAFAMFTENRKPVAEPRTMSKLLRPLRDVRVWRFGLYYFLVFGCFVAFAQWLVPYYVNVYGISLVLAGLFASLFSFPSGVIRALGGWLSDKWGARRVMYWVLGFSVAISLMLVVPKMQVVSPGRGVMALKAGQVEQVSDSLVKVSGREYPLKGRSQDFENADSRQLIMPTKASWHQPMVKVGDQVVKRQLLAKGVTQIYFQANVWVFTVLVIFIGLVWGIGKAAVYKHIPEYFPTEVGVVGGMVGVIGGLGGFFCPILFGYLLDGTGLWTSSWMLILLISALSLWWMNLVVSRLLRRKENQLENPS